MMLVVKIILILLVWLAIAVPIAIAIGKHLKGIGDSYGPPPVK